MTRPSGATLMVLKSFDNAGDGATQFQLLRAAPAGAVLRPFELRDAGHSFTMPLAKGRTRDYRGMLAALKLLWAAPSMRVCSREDYHTYAMTRVPGKSSFAAFPALYRAMQEETEEFYRSTIVDRPIEQDAFVHGDCTVSNFVGTFDGPRAIDLSPRPSPPEIEVDVAKLWVSATGFDIAWDKHRRHLAEALMELEAERPVSQVLLEYYRATHLLRVMSKEPPNDEGRFHFYKESIHDLF